MKKSTLALSVAAALGVFGMAGNALAIGELRNNAAPAVAVATSMRLNTDGIGHQLVVPYFSLKLATSPCSTSPTLTRSTLKSSKSVSAALPILTIFLTSSCCCRQKTSGPLPCRKTQRPALQRCVPPTRAAPCLRQSAPQRVHCSSRAEWTKPQQKAVRLTRRAKVISKSSTWLTFCRPQLRPVCLLPSSTLQA